MTDRVHVVLHVNRRGGLGGFAQRASSVAAVVLRIAIVAFAAWTLWRGDRLEQGAAAALGIALLWSVAAPLISRPPPPHALVMVTDDAIVYAEGAAYVEWPHVKAHVVAGDKILFEPDDEARRADPALRRRYAVPLGDQSREAILAAFARRPRATKPE